MSETSTLPEQIIETSRAFAQTLQLENIVFQEQLNGSVEMTLNAARELFALCSAVKSAGTTETAVSQKKLADTAQKAISDVQNATTAANKVSAPATPEAEAALDAAVLHAVGNSYQNAVNAQQQAYILQQAAATQLISTILSIATATLGMEVKEELTEGN